MLKQALLQGRTRLQLRIAFTQSFSVKPRKGLFDKILIANRGEIACRVIRTAKRLGIKTVAVYSDADISADHVRLADEAYHLGAAPASESYLRGDKIIKACIDTGAQAVHPGYGFLSENLQFCEQCKEAGVVFIGPPPFAIKAMGSKSESKTIMIDAGVPVTPGYHGSDQSDERLLSEAGKIGFPVMIKAVAGGGGKGMRVVENEKDFLKSLDSCRREAKKSFSNDEVLIEKLVENPRHVELQIFGDTQGNVVHLLERDCSIQRRHQKVLEEAPAPNLSNEVRVQIADAAVAAGKSVGYVGAGTVEFLMNAKTSEFYFCEMNTRLQVEHPVTEQVTGIDLVEWQLRVAANQPIPLTQSQILSRALVLKNYVTGGENANKENAMVGEEVVGEIGEIQGFKAGGCAIEARIYAENPVKGFLPATGRMIHWNPPINGDLEGVRVDSGLSGGFGITPSVNSFYDPMLAKLICSGANRPAALKILRQALRRFQVAGIATNIDFLEKVASHEGFTDQQPTTGFFSENLEEILESLRPKEVKSPSELLIGPTGFHLQTGLIALQLERQRQNHKTPQNHTLNSNLMQQKNEFAHFRNGRILKLTESVTDGNRENLLDFEISCLGLGSGSEGVISSYLINGLNEEGNSVSREFNLKKATLKSTSNGSDPNPFSVWEIVSVASDGNSGIPQFQLTATVAIHEVGVTKDFCLDVWVDNDLEIPAHHQFFIPKKATELDSVAGSTHPRILSPMPGRVVKLFVSDGQQVKKGDVICALEAMKMEHSVLAPKDGIVSLHSKEGDSVGEGFCLAEILTNENTTTEKA